MTIEIKNDELLGITDNTTLHIELMKLQQENKILRENAEHNDKAVDKVNWENQLLKQRIDKANDLIDTILTFNLFGEECPLNFGFEKDSLQEKAQVIFYEDDGEYCINNCDDCYKKCWLKFFKRIQELKGDTND